MLIFYSVALVLFSLYPIFIGLLGLTRKRPFAFASRQYMWVLLIALLPNLIFFFTPLFSGRALNNIFLTSFPFINVAISCMLVFVCWKQMTGYMVIGVYDETFRDSLTTALNKLNLPFQETISKIQLVELKTDLQATVTAWIGMAQINIKQREHTHYTKQIATEMNNYYETIPVKVNNTAFIFYLTFGILMLIAASIFITSQVSFLLRL